MSNMGLYIVGANALAGLIVGLLSGFLGHWSKKKALVKVKSKPNNFIKL